MLRKHWKMFYGGLSLAIVLAGCLTNPSISRASRAEIEGQLDTTGVMAWGGLAAPDSMAEIVQVAISAFLGLLGIIFVILIIYSGFNWMTARGDEEKVTLAKETLTRAVIGLIIIVAAYSITYFVFSNLPDGGAGGNNLGQGG